jgi:uncharacterized phosphosugar-binding protein
MSTAPLYTRKLIELLAATAESQDEVLDQVAARCADAIQGGGLVHLFGSGHSVIPTLEAFPRYGSFVGLHPLTDPRLMWHDVLGPGGVRELLWLERAENYADKFLDHEPLNHGDAFIVYSHGGRNAAAIDAAIYAAKRGLFTVAVTSLANRAGSVNHSSGKHLSDVCDLSVDTGVPAEDAVIAVEGWGRPLGGASTVVACVITHEIITRTAQLLSGRGHVSPTFVSPTVPGASLSDNDEVFAAHRRLMHEAEGRALSQDLTAHDGAARDSAP